MKDVRINMIKTRLIPFVKMQTLGNDFIIMDLRESPIILTSTIRSNIANRRLGVGSDQVITLHPPTNPNADVAIEVSNSNGSINNVCSNNIRCVAGLLLQETKLNSIHIETHTGVYEATVCGKEIAVKFENPSFKWDEIPLTHEVDTLYAPIDLGPLKTPSVIHLLKPHMVFFTSQLEHIPLDYLGSHLEHHTLFAKRANVILAQEIDQTSLRIRAWEKNVGISPGCSYGAAAAVVCAIKRGLFQENEHIECALDGGNLRVLVTGSQVWVKSIVSTTFTGVIDIGIWG